MISDLELRQKAKKRISKGNRFTQQEIREMAFWWVYHKHNNKKTAQELSSRLKRPITTKQIKNMAIKENFHAKEPFIQSAIEVYKYEDKSESIKGTKTPEENKLVEMGMSLLTIDSVLVQRAKDFVTGGDDKLFKNVKEVIDAMKYVSENVENLIGESNMRRNAWNYTTEVEAGQITEAAEVLLDQLTSKQQMMIVSDLEQKIIKGKL